MPRLSLGFDMEQFLNHCRMTKPPYECPHAACGRVYRSLSGIQNHMTSYDHENPPANLGSHKIGNLEPEPLPIPMSTDLKIVEFEVDGKPCTISVYDRFEIISKESYEASMPPALDEPPPESSKSTVLKPSNKTITPKISKQNRSKEKDRGVDVQRYTIEEKKSQKLPEASFKIIPGYYASIPDAPKMTDAYYKFVEKSPEELDQDIEYDMDEEDIAWLEIINEKRLKENLNLVSMENFELLMDRLEKESFFQAQSTGREPGAPIDEDAVCCICMDGECQNSNVILFCDMCNLAVHQECYGVPYIPEGQWLCRRCLQSPSRAVDCALCPNKGGAFKQTDDNRWAHVVCAMWIPEVCFANTVFLEPIDSIKNIPPARWKLTCYICVQRSVGACIQCNKVNCYTAFHVTCAQQAGLHMKIDAIRETSSNGTSVTVRKAAYCDMHTPADSDARPQVEELLDSVKKAAAKAASRQKMKKARKILAEKRSAAPIVSVPTLPANRIQQLANLVEMDKKAMFIHRLMSYWTLKRQSRNGVPLLRRLTTSYSRRNNNNESRNSPTKKSPEVKKKNKNKLQQISPVQQISNDAKFRKEIKYWQRLRQDLERARLLCELIRKREKTKRELLKVQAEERMTQLAPFVHLLLQKIDQLHEKDSQQIFAEPVDFEEVPDYLNVVKHPMDLLTMRQKVQAHQYQTVEQFSADFDLMVENCLLYNSKDTIFYRAGVKLRDQGGAIIRQLVRDVQTIGFCPETGLLLPHRPKPLPQISEDEIIQEVEEAANCELEEGETYEMRKEKLFELLDKADRIKHPVARIKRTKLIRRAIGVMRRKQALAESGANTSCSKNKDDENEEDSEKDDTDKDDSSIVDEEGEPGCPSRPSSPHTIPISPSPTPTVPSTNVNNQAASTLMSSEIASKSSGTSLVDSPSSLATSSLPISSPVTPKLSLTNSPFFSKRRPSVEQKTPVMKSRKKLRNKETPTSDLKQSKISSFFNRVESPSVKKSQDPDSPIHMPVPVESEPTREDADYLPRALPKKKPGRPFKNSLAAIGMIGKTKELPLRSSHHIKCSVDLEKCEDLGKSVKSSTHSSSAIESEKKAAFTKAPELFKPSNSEDCSSLRRAEKDEAPQPPQLVLPQASTKESFQIYRQGGEISQETDDDTQSESNSSSDDSEEESMSDTATEEGASDTDSSGDGTDGLSSTGEQIPLEPLDLVWAKCRGYPWYPALIINPKMPRTGYFHNRVPIPVPPEEVLAIASNYSIPMYLVLFFDQKRTWQWLPRNKLEPLGVNSALDKVKLVESRKPTDRKAVKRAYEKAILHRCRVTGENTGLSGESDNDDSNLIS